MLKKLQLITLIFIGLFYFNNAFAQQNFYNWRVGGNTGIVSYYGDLSYKFFKPSYAKLGYGAAGEWNFTKSSSFRFSYFAGEFSASDRQYQNNPNFDRALNFNTHFQAIDISYVYYTDNGKIFSERAFVSPYFFVGFGAMKFDVFADLFDENGQRYHYWQDGSIRNIDEASYTGSEVLEELERSFTYETNLSELNTEKADGYRNQTIYIPFGMGLKFRLGSRVNLNLEAKINYTFTNYLDDVGSMSVNPNLTDPTAIYAADPNNAIGTGDRGNKKWNLNDAFIFTSASLFFNFGKRKDAFNGPVLYAGNQPLNYTEVDEEQKTKINKQYISDSINQYIKAQNFAIAEQIKSETIGYAEDKDYYSLEKEALAIKTLKKEIEQQREEILKLQKIIENLALQEIKKIEANLVEEEVVEEKVDSIDDESIKIESEDEIIEESKEAVEEIIDTELKDLEDTEIEKNIEEEQIEQKVDEATKIEEETVIENEAMDEEEMDEEEIYEDAATFVGDDEILEELEENVTENFGLLMKSEKVNPNEEQLDVLEVIYNKLEKNANYNLMIIGYTNSDLEGDDEATIRRVLNIRSYFTLDKKISQTRVYTQYASFSSEEVENNYENVELKLINQ